MNDVAVVGGGIMGCSVALNLARGGMKVTVVEAGSICRAASAANPGTLSLQTKRAGLMGHAMRGIELWRTAKDWLGMDVGFERRGGLTLAFDDENASLLATVMDARRRAGAPIEMVGANRAREIEPALSEKTVAASYCAVDGYANSYLAGLAYRKALAGAGVSVKEGAPVRSVDRSGGNWVLNTDQGPVTSQRVVLAGGVWLTRMAPWFGVELPVECRVPQVVVTERARPLFRAIIGVATRNLTLKQAANGSILIGGGWQGIGDLDRGPEQIVADNVIGNLRLAEQCVPGLKETRIARTWAGLAARAPGWLPLVGPLFDVENVFVIGAQRSGFTGAPIMGLLLAQLMLGREPELEIFPPALMHENASRFPAD
jgi:sarcosine oxidase subunit beta